MGNAMCALKPRKVVMQTIEQQIKAAEQKREDEANFALAMFMDNTDISVVATNSELSKSEIEIKLRNTIKKLRSDLDDAKLKARQAVPRYQESLKQRGLDEETVKENLKYEAERVRILNDKYKAQLEITAKHISEKADLQRQLDELKGNLGMDSWLLEQATEKIDELRREKEELRQRLADDSDLLVAVTNERDHYKKYYHELLDESEKMVADLSGKVENVVKAVKGGTNDESTPV